MLSTVYSVLAVRYNQRNSLLYYDSLEGSTILSSTQLLHQIASCYNDVISLSPAIVGEVWFRSNAFLRFFPRKITWGNGYVTAIVVKLSEFSSIRLLANNRPR